MHLVNAIEKLQQRHEIDAERERLKITKASIAAKSGKSKVAVTYWFQAKIDSAEIETAVNDLISLKSSAVR